MSNAVLEKTGTKEGPTGGAARYALLTAGLLSDGGRPLQEATGDPEATTFFPNQRIAILCDDRTQAYEKSRQIGESFAFAADSLARAILEPATTNCHVSTDKWESQAKYHYIMRIIDAFPRAIRSTFRIARDTQDKIEIETSLGVSTIEFLAQRSPRGAERCGLYLHELAHMAKIKAIFKGGLPATTRGGFIKGCSSHEGSESEFNKIMTNATDEDTGEQRYKHWTRGSFPWWTCPVLCNDPVRAILEAPGMETEDRVEKFGTQVLKELRASSSLEDFQEEYECQVIDEKYSYFPLALIEACESKRDDYWFKKVEVTRKDVGAIDQVCRAIDDLALEIQHNRLSGRWFWGFDVGESLNPDGIVIGHTLREDPKTLAVRLAILMHGMPFPDKERVRDYVLRHIPIERGAMDAGGPGAQLGQESNAIYGQKVLPMKFTLQYKAEIVNALKIRMERRDATGNPRLILPVYGKLKRQIHSIRSKAVAGPTPVYDSERDDRSHADLFWALGMMNGLIEVPDENYAFQPAVIQRSQQSSGAQSFPTLGRGGIWRPGMH